MSDFLRDNAYSAHDVTDKVREHIEQIGSQQKKTDGIVSVLAYATLQDALTAIGTQEKTLYIPMTVNVTANLTIPTNINLKFDKAGKFNVSGGVTLTINAAIEAGLWRIFDGSGTVAGKPRIEAVHPEWFGAKVDDASIDNTLYLDKAQKFFPKVRLSAGVYNLLTSFVPVYSATFEGVGQVSDTTANLSIIKQLSNVPTIQLGKPLATFRNLSIRGLTTNANNHGVFFPSIGSRAHFENVYIESCGGDGVSANGTSTYGVDYVQFSNVKISSCEGYGIRLDLDPAGGNGFNTSTFINVECTKNQKGGFYINQARSLTFIRCHGFWNEDRNGATIKDYTVGATASNIKFINCWSESTGEHAVLDPKHLCAGFFVDGGKNISFDNCISEFNSRAFHIKSGENIIIDNPTHSQLNWAASMDILIESTADNVKVINYRPEATVKVANFSATSEIHFNAEKPTSGRIPYNAYFKLGNRGKAHGYQQGTVAQFELNATGVNGTAGNNYITYTTTALRVGDNIVVPGAGTAGAGLNAQIIDIDMTQSRLYLNTNIVTTISGVVPATAQAKVFSEAYSASAITNAQEGDILWESFPSINKRAGRICTVGGASPTWQAFGTWA